jgi:diguanylate cyclase (GGDEF)-like protein/hemerythrin-like metal-binding protein/PAS domain S-box-containing protein
MNSPIESAEKPGQQPTSQDAIDAFEIFPWTSDFETGIVLVDEQHERLVQLLNALARNLVSRSDAVSLDAVLHELSDYSEYHFESEEGLMRQFFPGDVLETGHRQAHDGFIQEIERMIAENTAKPAGDAVEEIVAFLSRWLAFHILESDRRMAKVVMAVQAGIPLDAAKAQADREMSGAVKVLIDAVLGMYEKLSSRTFQLMKEIVERKNAEIKLRLAATVFENTLEAIYVADTDHQIVDANASFCELTHFTRAELLGHSLEGVMPSVSQHDLWPTIWQSVRSQGHWRGEVPVRVGTGEPSPGWMTLSAINDDSGLVTHYVGVLSNITQLIIRQRQLEAIAHHDALTGLPNRLFLSDRIRQSIAQARRNDDSLAVCYLDLDGFKEINDTFGHAAGDLVLQEIATRCQALMRGNDTIARMGGDEFVLLLGDLKQSEDCASFLKRLLSEIRRPVSIGGRFLSVTASIGVTVFPADDGDPDALLHHADLAMYRAKQSGKSQHCFY